MEVLMMLIMKSFMIDFLNDGSKVLSCKQNLVRTYEIGKLSVMGVL